jgi:hypothetical protein
MRNRETLTERRGERERETLKEREKDTDICKEIETYTDR